MITCARCLDQFDGPVGFLCDPCELAVDAEAAEATQSRAAKRFLERLPETYRDADPARVPSSYRLKAEGFPLRLCFIGKSGSGKSCAMAVHLKARGEKFVWVSATDLRDITTKAATEGGDWTKELNRLKSIPVLAIDDLSQARFSEAFASALFDLLECRNAHARPIVWTSQKPIEELRRKIATQSGDEDQAAAISRRLSQDSTKLSMP